MTDKNKRPGREVKIEKGPFKGKTVVSPSPDDKIYSKELEPYVEKILEAVGHPEAMVSDMSMIGDFCDKYDLAPDPEMSAKKGRNIHKMIRRPEEEKTWLEDVSAKVGFEVKMDNYIYQVAEKLQKEED